MSMLNMGHRYKWNEKHFKTYDTHVSVSSNYITFTINTRCNIETKEANDRRNERERERVKCTFFIFRLNWKYVIT